MVSNQSHTPCDSDRLRSPLGQLKLHRGLDLDSPLARGRILCAIIFLGVMARVGSALYQGNTILALPGVFDQISYHELAVRVMEGHGFSFGTGWWPATPADHPTAHWSYLYVLFLAAVYSVTGPNPLTARLLQAILTGILQPLIAWRIGRRLFGPRVGLVSATLISFYAYFVFYAGALVTESLYIVAILWLLDISISIADPSVRKYITAAWKPWAELGIALAMASLLRQVILPLVPIILAWITWQVHHRTLENPLSGGDRRLQPSGVGRSARASAFSILSRITLTVAILFAFILPWTIRNYRAFGQLVLLNTNAGFAFFWGNHPIHGTKFIPLLPGNGTEYGALIPPELLRLNEAELDRALLRQGIDFVLKDPVRYLLLCVSRTQEYFKFWPSQTSSPLSNYARVLSFGLSLPFLLSGLLLAILGVTGRAGYSHQQNSPGVMFLLLISGLYCLVHLMTWTLVRYRLPVDAITMPFAALSMVYAYDRVFGAAQLVRAPLPQSAD